MHHDVFEWWANIWIPAALGITTLLVSLVALLVSHNASRIAGKVEEQRVRAAEERAADARRERLQGMALEEARVLHRYAVESVRPRWRPVGRTYGPAQRTADEQAAIDARVTLEQSLVPGAESILELTDFDLRHRWDHLPDEVDEYDPGYEAREALRDSIVENRDARMFERIRQWGLDPEGTFPMISEDLARIRRDRANYLMIGPAVNEL